MKFQRNRGQVSNINPQEASKAIESNHLPPATHRFPRCASSPDFAKRIERVGAVYIWTRSAFRLPQRGQFGTGKSLSFHGQLSMRVLVTGAAGSGTTTLAAALAERWQARHLEADEFFWLPTEPPYQSKREPLERNAMLASQLQRDTSCVVAGSIVGWGVEALLQLVVFLYVEPTVRLRRLQARETARFGRADPAFLEWAAQYDQGPFEGRSLAKHEAWLSSLSCPVVRLVGELSVQEQIAQVAKVLPPRSLPLGD